MYQEWFKEYEKLKNRGLKTMTEKEVIEKLTDNKKMTLIELIRKIKKEGMERFIVTRPEYIYTILNLLEKKDIDIIEAKEANRQLSVELQKKDKILDLMIKVMIDSGICDYFIKQNCKHYAGENKKLCDVCIKEYFEKKVEGEK